MEISLSSLTDPISSQLVNIELRYLYLADVTGYCRPRPDFLTGIIINLHTMGRSDFGFPKKKMRQKGFPEKLLHSRKHVYFFFVMRRKNIHSDWIAQTTAAELS